MTPQERELAVFAADEGHAEFAYENSFRGCGLLNAAAELPAGAPVREDKEDVEAIPSAHQADLISGDAESARGMTRHIAFLLEGSISRAGLEGNSGCVTQAETIAEKMMVAY